MFPFFLLNYNNNLNFNTLEKETHSLSLSLSLSNPIFLSPPKMKFTPSSSVSSSTTTTSSSVSENFWTSKGNAFGCLAGVLSRILCSKSLPTHPSDPIESHKQQHFFKIEKIVDGSATPNIVARLMGLDSMPEIDFKAAHVDSDSISITRSESVMSSEGFRRETEQMQGQHRRAKTAISFRETPDYFEVEDDDFLVLSFENKSEKKKKKGSKSGNSEVGSKGHKQRSRREKCGRKQRRNREEQGRNRVFSNEDRLSLKISAQNSQQFESISNVDVQNQSCHLSPSKDKPNCSKEDSDGTKPRKKKKKESCLADVKEEEETVECDSDNSSPVSVLDYREFTSDHEPTTSAEEDAKVTGSNTGSDYVNGDFASDQTSGSSVDHERCIEGNEERNVGLKRIDYRKPENIQMLSRICRLAGAEINNSNWKYRGMLSTNELEDASTEFGQQIFDQLVSELVDQLIDLKC